MRIDIDPVVINGVTCTHAEVSLSISGTSLSMRLVPCAFINRKWTEYPDHAGAVIGSVGDDPDVETALEALIAVAGDLVTKTCPAFVPPEVLHDLPPPPPPLTRAELHEQARKVMLHAAAALEAATTAIETSDPGA